MAFSLAPKHQVSGPMMNSRERKARGTGDLGLPWVRRTDFVPKEAKKPEHWQRRIAALCSKDQGRLRRGEPGGIITFGRYSPPPADIAPEEEVMSWLRFQALLNSSSG